MSINPTVAYQVRQFSAFDFKLEKNTLLVAMQADEVIGNGDDLVVESGSTRTLILYADEDLARAFAQRFLDLFPSKGPPSPLH